MELRESSLLASLKRFRRCICVEQEPVLMAMKCVVPKDNLVAVWKRACFLLQLSLRLMTSPEMLLGAELFYRFSSLEVP